MRTLIYAAVAHTNRGNRQRLFLLLVCLLSWIAPAFAADRAALLVGNSSYAGNRLAQPANDATDLAAALRGLGYEVRLATDLDRAGLLREITQFRRLIKPGGLALVYYAGYAVDAHGDNWLLPISRAPLKTALDVSEHAVSVKSLLETLEEANARLNLVILDASRDTPLPLTVRGASRGLAPMGMARSSLIAYAAAPGTVSADGSGHNSLYATALKEALATPGLSVSDVLNLVGSLVITRTGGAQIPWQSGSAVWPPLLMTAPQNGKGLQQAAARGESGLHVTVSPANARVLANDELLGTGERRVPYPAGTRVRVRVEADGYLPREQAVTIPRNDYVLVNAMLLMPYTLPGQLARGAGKPARTLADFSGAVPGLVIDTVSGLEWLRSDGNEDVTFNAARRKCERVGGGFRLPTIEELETLYIPDARGIPCGNYEQTRFTCKTSPLFQLSGTSFWSSTPSSPSRMWSFGLVRGMRNSSMTNFLAYEGRVLCVR